MSPPHDLYVPVSQENKNMMFPLREWTQNGHKIYVGTKSFSKSTAFGTSGGGDLKFLIPSSKDFPRFCPQNL